MSQLHIKASLTGGVLPYRIEKVKSFKVIGKAVRHERDKCDVHARLWQQCRSDGTIQTLAGKIESFDSSLVGLLDYLPFDDETQMYYVGIKSSKEQIPEGYIVKEIPERTWIKFFCWDLPEQHADSKIWNQIYKEYFLTSDYSPNKYQMVVFPANGNKRLEANGEVWIEVKKN
jgi:predicted transcriptional regulator YdeE